VLDRCGPKRSARQPVIRSCTMKTFTHWILTAILLCQISACSTPEQLRAQELKRQAVLRGAEANRQALLDARCRGYGFELRTAGFAQCMMKLDQADRQTAQAESQRRQLESRCELARAQGYGAPTRTGGWSESLENGTNAYSACMAGLPAPQGTNIICQRQGANDVYCFRQ
jgi:hypothetical protein